MIIALPTRVIRVVLYLTQAYKNVMTSSVSNKPRQPRSCQGPDCLVSLLGPPSESQWPPPPQIVDSIQQKDEAPAAAAGEPTLPGLEHLKSDQLFFLNFAQVWCGSFRHEALRYYIL